jgi:polar amino acid transport system permease protein
MAYELQFADLGEYLGMFASGAATTLGLTAVSTALGIGVGVAGAAASDSRHAWLR